MDIVKQLKSLEKELDRLLTDKHAPASSPVILRLSKEIDEIIATTQESSSKKQ